MYKIRTSRLATFAFLGLTTLVVPFTGCGGSENPLPESYYKSVSIEKENEIDQLKRQKIDLEQKLAQSQTKNENMANRHTKLEYSRLDGELNQCKLERQKPKTSISASELQLAENEEDIQTYIHTNDLNQNENPESFMRLLDRKGVNYDLQKLKFAWGELDSSARNLLFCAYFRPGYFKSSLNEDERIGYERFCNTGELGIGQLKLSPQDKKRIEDTFGFGSMRNDDPLNLAIYTMVRRDVLGEMRKIFGPVIPYER